MVAQRKLSGCPHRLTMTSKKVISPASEPQIQLSFCEEGRAGAGASQGGAALGKGGLKGQG